jgi:hypothetical protein
MGAPRHYSIESIALQKTPWVSFPSNPKSLAVNPNRARWRQSCSGDGGHRRRGSRVGKGLGSYCGLVALLVVDGDGRNSGVLLEPEVTAEGSPSTAELRWRTLSIDLCKSFSETRGMCRYYQLEEVVLD